MSLDHVARSVIVFLQDKEICHLMHHNWSCLCQVMLLPVSAGIMELAGESNTNQAN